MTTSISLLMHGDLAAAWRANWSGVLVGMIGAVATMWLGLIAGGRPRRPRYSAEHTILALTIVSAALVIVRYIGVVGAFVAAHR